MEECQLRIRMVEGQRGEGYKVASPSEFDNYMGNKAIVGTEFRKVYCQKPPETPKIGKKRPPKLVAGKKLRYHVKVNWFGEVHDIWTYALCEMEALTQALKRLSPKFRYRFSYVLNSVLGRPGSWEVVHE